MFAVKSFDCIYKFFYIYNIVTYKNVKQKEIIPLQQKNLEKYKYILCTKFNYVKCNDTHRPTE